MISAHDRASRVGRARESVRRAFSWLPLIGLVPAFLLATWSLTQPWAEGRALLLWGISRSPGAAILLSVTLVAMVGASVAAATRGKRREVAALVHIVSGFAMVGVALAAFSLIREAPTRLFGLLPLASIRPAEGLFAFLWSALLVLLLGLVEGALWWRERVRSRTISQVVAQSELVEGQAVPRIEA